MKIEFFPSSLDAEYVNEPPQPAFDLLPKWYKDTKIFNGSGPKYSDGELINKNIKSCQPFYDSMINGYIQKTWCDIHIEVSLDGINYTYSMNKPLIMSHREHISIPRTNKYHPIEFLWHVHWAPKLPKGYSALITHPSNRLDLPFTTLSGIIDADKFYSPHPGNLPFYLNDNFSGVIPAGTPMYQIIPIKREKWNSEYNRFNEKILRQWESVQKKKFIGVYKHFFHEKKYFK